MVAWDREDYIAKVSKQWNDESVYKSVKFKDKVLQDLAEESNRIFKGLKQKRKITENNQSILQLNMKKLPIWGKCIYFQRSIKSCMISLAGQLYQIDVEHLQKRPRNFQIRKLSQTVGLILRTPTIL